MRNATVYLACLVAISAGCGGDDPASPVVSEETPIAEERIGPDGGELGAGAFALSVPQGAFDSQHTLRVFVARDEDPYGDDALSEVYRIDGLPQDYTRPLRVRVRHEAPPGGEVELGVGVEMADVDGDSGVFYLVHAAIDSSGHAVGVLPVPEVEGGSPLHVRASSSTEPFSSWIVSFKKRETMKSSADHFEFHYRAYLGPTVTVLANYMEEIYDELGSLGFDMGPLRAYGSSIPIQIRKFTKQGPRLCRAGQVFVLSGYRRYYVMVIDEDRLSQANLPQLRSDLANRFFWALPTSRFPFHVNDRKLAWTNAAIASWFESRFQTTGDHAPLLFADNFAAPFNGLQPDGTATTEQLLLHGGGLSALFEHLADSFGPETPSRIFAGLEVGTSGIEAVIEGLNDPEYLWWPAFFESYVAGEIYGLEATELLSTIPPRNTVKVDPFTTQPMYLDGTYRDVSAKLFRVNLDFPDPQAIDDQLKLNFKLGPESLNLDYVTVMVFGVKNGRLEYLDHAVDLTITGIKTLVQDGVTALIPVVINCASEEPYDGTLNIDLDVSVVEPSPFNYGIIKVRTKASYEYNDGSSASGHYLYTAGRSRSGDFVNDTFYSSWNGPFSDGTSSGTLEVTVDLEALPPVVTDYFITETITLSDTEVNTISGTGVSIPGQRRPVGGYRFYVSTAAACTNISQFTYRRDGEGGYWVQAVGAPTCDGDSYIEIILDKQ